MTTIIAILFPLYLAILGAAWTIINKNKKKFEKIRIEMSRYFAVIAALIFASYVGVAYLYLKSSGDALERYYISFRNNSLVLSMFFVLLIVGLFVLSNLHKEIEAEEEQ